MDETGRQNPEGGMTDPSLYTVVDTKAPATATTPAAASAETDDGTSRARRVVTMLAHRWRWTIFAFWLVVLVMWILTAPLLWLSWFILIPQVWHWAGSSVIKLIAALFGSLMLGCVPIWWGMAATAVTGFISSATITKETMSIDQARREVRETEADVLRQLEQSDAAGLLPLLRYSRAQLDAYYAMSLAQTRRSFLNAAIAMWLGFLILIAGIGLYIGPVELLGISRPPQEFSTLVLIGAVIVEVISALFLWVYQSTIAQLTFYYRRQMQSHAAILCFRIAASMTDGDASKRAIIEQLIQISDLPERHALPTGERIAALAKPKLKVPRAAANAPPP